MQRVSVRRNQYHRLMMMVHVTERVKICVKVRRLSHLTLGFSWYADPTVRDLSVHLLFLSISLKDHHSRGHAVGWGTP